MSSMNDCQKNLLDMFDKKGFLTFDDIIDVADTFNLSISELDKLSEYIQLKGALILNEDHNQEQPLQAEEDYSKIDYTEIYKEIIKCEPNLKYIVNKVSELPTTQHGEISELTRQIANGNSYARERLILLHLRVVLKIALSLSKMYDFDLSDAISAGFQGLTYAVDKYNVSGYSAFQSYASLYIQNFIQRNCIMSWMQRYYPSHLREKMYSIIRICKEKYGELTEYNLKSEEFFCECELYTELSSRDVRKLIEIMSNDIFYSISLSAIESDFEPETDLLMDLSFIEKSVDILFLKSTINKVIERLSEKEKKVIQLRYGLTGISSKTLEEVGQIFDLSRERIRQIEQKALRKMKRQLINHNFDDWV